jgi:hypothetical protein
MMSLYRIEKNTKKTKKNNPPGVLSSKVSGVHSAQNHLPSFLPVLVTVQPEGEDRLFEQVLIEHVLEGGRDLAYRNFREAQTL